MFFNCKGIAVLATSLSLSYQVHAADRAEQEIELIAQPNKCVALTQGRVCYAQVKVTWTATLVDNVCLVDLSNQISLYCWKGKSQGQYTYEMEAASDIKLTLVRGLENQQTYILPAMATATLKVSWLYEGNARKRRWRLF